jgi:hypothetical protein
VAAIRLDIPLRPHGVTFAVVLSPMRILWFIPAILAIGASVFLRRRRNREISLSTEPVSGEWLAQARSREEHRW